MKLKLSASRNCEPSACTLAYTTGSLDAVSKVPADAFHCAA